MIDREGGVGEWRQAGSHSIDRSLALVTVSIVTGGIPSQRRALAEAGTG
jgi:hypothetical protein